MSQVPIWFERKFEFSFPAEQLPNLCARLRGTPARLEEVLRGRSHAILVAKAQSEWSAQENAGHLLDLEPLWLARVGDYVADSDQLTVADLKNRKTDEANHNARPLEQILSEFRAAREIPLQKLSCVLTVWTHHYLVLSHSPLRRQLTPMRLVRPICILSPNTTIIISREYGNSSTPPGLYLTGMESERAATEREWPQLNL